ncbi:MAG: sulfotransferase [Pseudomonadota bacterium]
MSDYSAIDRIFHRIVLPSSAFGEMLGDLDGAFTPKDAPSPERPVYVTGLARAGTTVLMRALYGSGDFASLTYADMPMVMAPNLWARLSRRFSKDRVATERAHGDGVFVDFDAPEALEEVFWRVHCGQEYIRPDALIPHNLDEKALAAYRTYVSRICARYGKKRYLAKNNNLMLRINALNKAMPDARFLVAVRDPIAQAQSLLNQHNRFARADAFTAAYMRWLVHHEFGADARPYSLTDQPMPTADRDSINYWLTLWIACYGWLLNAIEASSGGLRAVVYEVLCADPEEWRRVAAFACVEGSDDPGFRSASPMPDAPSGADSALVEHARALYSRFEALTS